MNPNLEEICKDPLFQLNLALWISQPHPSPHIYPLFYKSGLNIYSIGPSLALPPDIRLEVSGKINCQDSGRPDLVLELKSKKTFCVLECKTSSFSSQSSTSKQARTFLLITGPIISEVLGIGGKRENQGILCYFIGAHDTGLMETTLENLAKEIKCKTSLRVGKFGCFGIKPSKLTVVLEYSDHIKSFLNLVKDSPVDIIKFEEDTDPRPLYFIPYDPNVEQTEQEQKLCRRILFERILSQVISQIGGVTTPASITFTTGELLSSATLGLYEIWEDAKAKKNMRKLVNNFLTHLKKSVDVSLRGCIRYERQRGWIFDLENNEIHEELLRQLQRFKPENLDLSEQIQLTLFNNF